jgi:hypothetical protein
MLFTTQEASKELLTRIHLLHLPLSRTSWTASVRHGTFVFAVTYSTTRLVCFLQCASGLSFQVLTQPLNCGRPDTGAPFVGVRPATFVPLLRCPPQHVAGLKLFGALRPTGCVFVDSMCDLPLLH